MLPNLRIPDENADLLPADNLSVLDFLQFDTPGIVPTIRFNMVDYLSDRESNITNADEIKQLPLPPISIIQALFTELSQPTMHKQSIICPHFPLVDGKRFPLWIVTFWSSLITVKNAQKRWADAVTALEKRMYSPKLTDLSTKKRLRDCYAMFACLEWSGSLSGFDITPKLLHLTSFFTKEWLDDEHIHLILELIRQDIQIINPDGACHIHPHTGFLDLLTNAANMREQYIDGSSRDAGWLRQLGDELAGGIKNQLGFIANRNANHWLAVVMDFRTQCISYGDSMGYAFDRHQEEILTWWAFTHTGEQFDIEKMPITLQRDGHSCGIFASNALASLFLDVPLVPSEQAADARLDLFVRIIKKHQSSVSQPSTSPYHACSVNNEDDIQAQSSKQSSDTPLASSEKKTCVTSSETESHSTAHKTKSAIREAVEMAEAGNRHGLLKFFQKSSPEEYREQLARHAEKTQAERDQRRNREEVARMREKETNKEKARLRKQQQRARDKAAEIIAGIRSPGGSKLSKKREVSYLLLY